MKKSALTNLIVLIAIKSVSACEFQPGEEPVSVFKGNEIYFWVMFIGSFALLVPIIVLYFQRNHRGLWTIITSIVLLILFLPAIFMAKFANMCGDETRVAEVIIAEFFLMSLIFTIQFSSWTSQRKTSIKLR
jgi:hypothetical protein